MQIAMPLARKIDIWNPAVDSAALKAPEQEFAINQFDATCDCVPGRRP